MGNIFTLNYCIGQPVIFIYKVYLYICFFLHTVKFRCVLGYKMLISLDWNRSVSWLRNFSGMKGCLFLFILNQAQLNAFSMTDIWHLRGSIECMNHAQFGLPFLSRLDVGWKNLMRGSLNGKLLCNRSMGNRWSLKVGSRWFIDIRLVRMDVADKGRRAFGTVWGW